MKLHLGALVFSSVGERGYIAAVENGGAWIGVFWARHTGCYWYKGEDVQRLTRLLV